MNKILENYNTFLEQEKTTWKSRFTWCGLSGDTPKYTINMMKFFNETNIIEESVKVEDVNSLFTLVEAWSVRYVEWVMEKNNIYNKKEYEDMRNFFIGAVGEFFFVTLLNEVRCLMVPMDDKFKRFDFNSISPRLEGDDDWGADLIGYANDTPSVFQVKFWNPFAKTKATIDIFQKADWEGIRNEFTNKEDNDNVFLCWLGSESSGRNRVKLVKPLQNKVVIIGRDSLDASINNRNKHFWEIFYNKLIEICK